MNATLALTDHLLTLVDKWPAIREVATEEDEKWRAHVCHHQCVIDALENSRLGQQLRGIWEFGDIPLPAPHQHQFQLEMLLKRNTDATRASVERILYELYGLNTSHIWELENDLWP